MIMEGSSFFSVQYMIFGYSNKSLEIIKCYLDACKKFDGDFVLLWHNSFFDSVMNASVYKELVRI